MTTLPFADSVKTGLLASGWYANRLEHDAFPGVLALCYHGIRASADVMANGLDIVLHDPDVRVVFVNVFGGITSCDAVASGIVAALGILGEQATKPLVVRLDGNNVEEGRRILAEAAHPLVTLADTMDDGAEQAARLANAGV